MIDLKISYNKLITCIILWGAAHASAGDRGNIDGEICEVMESAVCNNEKEYEPKKVHNSIIKSGKKSNFRSKNYRIW